MTIKGGELACFYIDELTVEKEEQKKIATFEPNQDFLSHCIIKFKIT